MRSRRSQHAWEAFRSQASTPMVSSHGRAAPTVFTIRRWSPSSSLDVIGMDLRPAQESLRANWALASLGEFLTAIAEHAVRG